jgi:hypothetical protein
MIDLNANFKKIKYFLGHQAAILALNVHEEKELLVRK